MKIAFVGKGGSGKTTLASTTARYVATNGLPVLAIDADINQHLGQSLGFDAAKLKNIPAMGLEMNKIKEYLVGTNTYIGSAGDMIKTTPPGTGSRLLTIDEQNPVYDYFVREHDGVRFIAVGPFTEEDLGVKCYHSKTGSVELLLNHLIDKKGEYVVVDMTAGADSFASGLFTRFDVTFLVVEPTVKSVSVYEQYKRYAKQYNVHIKVIANKVEDEGDIAFVRDAVGDDLVAICYRSQFIRSMEKGIIRPFSEIEPENMKALEDIISEVDSREKDWDMYYAQAIEFHKKNAESWANDAAGTDLVLQIDPTFSLKTAVENM